MYDILQVKGDVHMNKIIGVVLVLVVLGGVTYTLTQKNTVSKAPANVLPVLESGKPTENPVVTNDGMITVESSSFKFVPNTLKVKKGVATTLVLKNTEGMHNFVVDELNIKTKIVKGVGQDSITFTADKFGTFEFYCSVGSHRAMGMTGSLIVE